MKNKFSRINVCLKLFRNGLSIFLGILFLGLMSCSSPTDSTSSNPTKDKIPPTVTISTNKSLEKDKTGTITFIFSEKVNGFTKNDIRFSSDDFSVNDITDFSVNDITIGNFITNKPREYSLDITPKVAGTLTISIPANSFEDLFSNKNTNSFSTNFSVEDKTPPTVNINSDILIEGIPAYLTFVFSEKVTNFTPDDIQFLTNEANGVNAAKGNFVTNNLTSYSLEITPKTNGTLFVSIQANSFEDLSGNQSAKEYTSNFEVHPPSYTISFKLNGGVYSGSQKTNLEINTGEPIKETQLVGILSYPPTGPKPSIQAVNRDIFEWRTNGTKYDFSTPVSSDLTLEAVWSNSCGKVETFHPTNRSELKTYTDAAVRANTTTNLNHIDTSAITDMNNLFFYKTSFNGKIGCWNTANVTNMGAMFLFAYVFNQDISTWNVANVTNMRWMFYNAQVFNQDISRWYVGNVTNMRWMFYNAQVFNQDISRWYVGNVNNMRGMFYGASAFNQDIGSWDVSNVNTMFAMFNNASAFNQDIGSWDVANVNNMNNMFFNAYAFNQDISSWNVANVNNMRSMFNKAFAFNQDISSWNVANVTNMSSMFNKAFAFNQDISSWNVANVTNMSSMFSDARAFNQDIGSWNVSNVNNVYGMFAGATNFNQDIGSWNVANVTTMRYMFYYAYAFNQDISSWDVSKVNNMRGMFYNATRFSQNLSSWSVNNVTNHDNMFTDSAMASETNKHPSFPSP